MPLFNFYTDEDGRFIQNTEGRCMNCGEWVECREKVYGLWLCHGCAESEQFNE
jgi:hypothetical protein